MKLELPPSVLHYWPVAAAVVAFSLVYFKGRSDGEDHMRRANIVADERRTAKDKTIRDSIAKSVSPRIKQADSAYTVHSVAKTKVEIKDPTHITIHRTPEVKRDGDTVVISTKTSADTTVEVPKEITEDLKNTEDDYIREHNLRLDLQAQIRADSAVISDQATTISDLKELKDKPGTLADAAMGAGTGAAVGAIVGGVPGALIGAGVGAVAGGVWHVVFRR